MNVVSQQVNFFLQKQLWVITGIGRMGLPAPHVYKILDGLEQQEAGKIGLFATLMKMKFISVI